MRGISLARMLPAILVLAPGARAPAQAGMGEMDMGGGLFSFMIQAIPLLTRATPTAGGRSVSEAYLSQPVVMALGSIVPHVDAVATLNLEGLTLRRGELDTGASGEGFVDRRHPHTYVHELLLGGSPGA